MCTGVVSDRDVSGVVQLEWRQGWPLCGVDKDRVLEKGRHKAS